MYENFYNLESSPFRLGPDPRFFFGSKGHSRALAYLRYGLKQKEGFIVVTGSPGTGKTTLARALLEDIGREKIIVAELNTTHLEPDDVLRMTAAAFGLEYEGATKASLLKRLEAYFLGRYRAGYHLLLIVDESQNLPHESVEELRMLSNFYTGKNALIQIFLLGQQQFRDSLYSADMEQLRQRVVASCHLEPLNQTETKEYIEHRLLLVGWQQDPQISDRAFARIFQMTKGVPRRINTFCDRLFLFCSLEEIHEIKDEQIKAIAKELMCEVSAKDVDLSCIDVENTPVDKQPLIEELVEQGSVELTGFSDDVVKKEVINKEALFTSKTDERKNQPNNSTPPSHHSPRLISHENVAVESFEPAIAFNAESKPDWCILVALAVDYYRKPDADNALVDNKIPLAQGVTEMLQVAVGKRKILQEQRVDLLLDVGDEEIREACVHYIKYHWINNNADYYRRLGVNEDASLSHIREHYRYLFRLLQTDSDSKNPQDELSIRRINQAFSVLRSDEERREYDAFLWQAANDTQPDFLTDEDVNISSDTRPEIPGVPQKTQGSSRALLVSLALAVVIGGAGGAYYFQSDLEGLIQRVTERSQIFIPQSAKDASATREVVVSSKTDVLTASELEMHSVEDAQIAEDIVNNIVLAPLPSQPLTDEIAPEIIILSTNSVASASVDSRVKPKIENPVLSQKPVKAPVLASEKVNKSPLKAVEPVRGVEIKPEPVKQVAKPVLSKPMIRQTDVEKTTNKFSVAYEKGELDSFMSLFSKDAVTNDNGDWNSIRNDYQTLFSSTQMREIELFDMKWVLSDLSAVGKGNFIVTVLSHQDDEPRKFTGNIRLEAQKKGDSTLIRGMYHSYGTE